MRILPYFPVLNNSLGILMVTVALLLMWRVRPYLLRYNKAHAHGMNILAIGMGCGGLVHFSPDGSLEQMVLGMMNDTFVTIGILGITFSLWPRFRHYHY